MKKHETPTRALLGITQNDMAQLLGVSRNQWALYESGKRGLPAHAVPVFARLMTYMQQQMESGATARSVVPQDQKSVLAMLQQLLEANRFQYRLTVKKVAAAQKKQDQRSRMAQVAAFLEEPALEGKQQRFMDLAPLLGAKLSPNWASNSALLLLRLELKLELLELERLLLEAKIGKHGRDSIENQ